MYADTWTDSRVGRVRALAGPFRRAAISMTQKGPLLPQEKDIPIITKANEPDAPVDCTLATRDHDVVMRWAARRQAEPATGEHTKSGSATSVDVQDGGAGIRFNFPGAAPFRSIDWDEWFENFDRHDLTFVYEEEPSAGSLSARYRLVKTAEWTRHFR